MKQLILTIGIQGSGKSSYAIALANSLQSCVIIERDNLRHQFQQTEGKFYDPVGVNWPEWKWSNENKITHMFNQQLMSSVEDDSIKTIIISDVNINVKTRFNIIDTANAFYRSDVDVEFVIIDTPVEVCISRDAQRKFPVGEQVIRDTSKRFENQLRSVIDNNEPSLNGFPLKIIRHF